MALNFKENLIRELKEVGVKLIGVVAFALCVQGIAILYCYAMISVIKKFPQSEKELNIIGLIGIGYVLISLMLYMFKKFN